MSSLALFVRSALLLAALPQAFATLYITHPLTSTTCTGGKQCTVTWVDDGVAPTLGAIGSCYVGLYNNNGVLVQQIEPVDVASVHSLTFTLDPKAGPNSNKYYINFTSIDPSKGYNEFSTFFTLNGMSGSLSHPDPSDTSAISVPSTVASPAPQSIHTTITVGLPSPSVSASVSGSGSVSGPASSHSDSSSGSLSTTASPSTPPSSINSAPSGSLSSRSLPVSPSLATPPVSSVASGSPTSSFITIRTSSASPPPLSATTLVVPPPPTSLSPVFSAASTDTPAPSAASGSSQTSGAVGARQGVDLTGICIGAMIITVWSWI
ncbi:hypothetical protein BC629DRAFT_1718865 [Irpex lacteus]|nr:hypothetical protein BC629DRAFT_1718865 [Irpex lacteus]